LRGQSAVGAGPWPRSWRWSPRRASLALRLASWRVVAGFSPNQLFTWRRLAEQGALTATQAEEEVVPASAFRAQQEQIRELQRLLGKKTLENEILKEALDIATESKKRTLRLLSLPKDGSQ
jgi:transposase